MAKPLLYQVVSSPRFSCQAFGLAVYAASTNFMSIHSSLKASTSGTGQRNVWTRVERIAALKKDGRWTPESGVTGLPKVRTSFKVVTKKKKKAKDKEEEDKK